MHPEIKKQWTVEPFQIVCPCEVGNYSSDTKTREKKRIEDIVMVVLYIVGPHIHRFFICKFILFPNQYLLHFCSHLQICTKLRVAKNLSHPMCTLPAAVKQGNNLPSYFSSHAENKYPFHSQFHAGFCFFCTSCW